VVQGSDGGLYHSLPFCIPRCLDKIILALDVLKHVEARLWGHISLIPGGTCVEEAGVGQSFLATIALPTPLLPLLASAAHPLPDTADNFADLITAHILYGLS
jgi:hypothetical protein